MPCEKHMITPTTEYMLGAKGASEMYADLLYISDHFFPK